jgi:hypothetical protein
MDVTCPCQHCDKALQFDADRAGQTVDCPHCGMETLLFVSPGSKRRAIVEAGLQDNDAIYHEGDITVTRTLLKVGVSTYPIASISSFCVVSIPPDATILSFLSVMTVLGLLIGIAMISSKPFDGGDAKIGLFLIVFGILAGVCAFIIHKGMKSTFALSITTSAGEKSVVASPKFEAVQIVELALQKAIEMRG